MPGVPIRQSAPQRGTDHPEYHHRQAIGHGNSLAGKAAFFHQPQLHKRAPGQIDMHQHSPGQAQPQIRIGAQFPPQVSQHGTCGGGRFTAVSQGRFASVLQGQHPGNKDQTDQAKQNENTAPAQQWAKLPGDKEAGPHAQRHAHKEHTNRGRPARGREPFGEDRCRRRDQGCFPGGDKWPQRNQ